MINIFSFSKNKPIVFEFNSILITWTSLNDSHTMNITNLLIKYLPKYQVNVLLKSGSVAQKLNMTLYLVGGAVRDILIGNCTACR